MNKYCVYTCFNRGYDDFEKCKVIYPNSNIDYLSFTDFDGTNYDNWQNIKIIFDVNPRLTARTLKILGYSDISSYDYNIWIDGRINIIANLDDLIEKMEKQSLDILVCSHPFSRCKQSHRTFDVECEMLRKCNYLPSSLINKNYNQYIKDGIDKNQQCFMSGFILRKNNDKVKEFNNIWYQQTMLWQHENVIRDQPGLIYALNYSNVRYSILNLSFKRLKTVLRCKYFQIGKHNHVSRF